MSLKYKFRKAGAVIRNLSPEDRAAMTAVCRDIRDAEDRLIASARENLAGCVRGCEGLCCKNIQLDEIIGLWDIVYIRAMAGDLRDDMAACLENEVLFYSHDCIFLKNGVGPCIFPFNLRPEVCITTFCGGAEKIQPDIRRVKQAFKKLPRHIRRCNMRERRRGIAAFFRRRFPCGG